jgi:hypothetical protein
VPKPCAMINESDGAASSYTRKASRGKSRDAVSPHPTARERNRGQGTRKARKSRARVSC